MLAARGGAEWVALWAQLASVVELVAGVAMAGVGTGLAVYVARTRREERQRELLRESLVLGLAIALPVGVLASLGGFLFGGDELRPLLVATAAAAGCIAVVPGLVNNYWLGQQRRGRMLALAAGSALVALAAALLAPARLLLECLALSQALPAVVLLWVRPAPGRPRFRARSHPLRRYILPGLAIGILSPASLLAARAIVGEALSWHDAGVLQALWRVSDWVCAFAAGFLSVYYLPRFAALRSSPELPAEMRRAALRTLAPAIAVFVLLFLVQGPLIAALYEPGFAAPDGAVALLFAGSVVRIASWIPLVALYAMRRTRAIAAGELLSLPLFAALCAAFGKDLTLPIVGAVWLASFVAYSLFNFWAARRAA